MAGRIPQHFIDELVARADIAELIGSRVPLKKQGREFKACCPFHGEKTPSFTVVPDKGFYHCFGCGAHGTALGFLMDHDHLSFVEAVEELASRVGLEVPREDGVTPRPSPSDGLFAALEKTAELYRRELRGSERGRNYFKGRGLTGETAARFGLGYAPDAWDFVLKHLGGSEGERLTLLQVGLVIERERRPDAGQQPPGYYDRFRDRVMFPIRDARGRTIGFGGRVLDKGEPKYLNSPETELFHKGRELYGLYEARQASRTLTRLLVVEGYMDVVRLHQAGIEYAVATLGTATTPDHLSRIFRICQEVVFCFDGDRAGRAAAWRALENCLPQIRDGRQMRFLFLPDGHDPDSLVGEEGKEQFEARVRNAEPLLDYLLAYLKAQVDMTTMAGRARLQDLARPLLDRVPEGIPRDMLEEAVRKQKSIVDSGLVAAKATVSRPEGGPSRSTGVRGSLVRQAIRSLVHHPGIAKRVPIYRGLEKIDRPGIPLLVELLEDLREHPCPNTAALLERWRGRADAEHLTRLARSDYQIEAEGALADLIGALEQLFPERLDQRLDELVRKQAAEGLTDAERTELQAFLTTRRNEPNPAGQRT